MAPQQRTRSQRSSGPCTWSSRSPCFAIRTAETPALVLLAVDGCRDDLDAAVQLNLVHNLRTYMTHKHDAYMTMGGGITSAPILVHALPLTLDRTCAHSAISRALGLVPILASRNWRIDTHESVRYVVS